MLDLARLRLRLRRRRRLVAIRRRRRAGDVEKGEFAEEGFEAVLLVFPVDLDAEADEDCAEGEGEGRGQWGGRKGEERRRKQTEGEFVEVWGIAGEDEGKTVDLAGVGEAEGEVLVKHRARAHQGVVNPLLEFAWGQHLVMPPARRTRAHFDDLLRGDLGRVTPFFVLDGETDEVFERGRRPQLDPHEAPELPQAELVEELFPADP